MILRKSVSNQQLKLVSGILIKKIHLSQLELVSKSQLHLYVTLEKVKVSRQKGAKLTKLGIFIM